MSALVICGQKETELWGDTGHPWSLQGTNMRPDSYLDIDCTMLEKEVSLICFYFFLQVKK